MENLTGRSHTGSVGLRLFSSHAQRAATTRDDGGWTMQKSEPRAMLLGLQPLRTFGIWGLPRHGGVGAFGPGWFCSSLPAGWGQTARTRDDPEKALATIIRWVAGWKRERVRMWVDGHTVLVLLNKHYSSTATSTVTRPCCTPLPWSMASRKRVPTRDAIIMLTVPVTISFVIYCSAMAEALRPSFIRGWLIDGTAALDSFRDTDLPLLGPLVCTMIAFSQRRRSWSARNSHPSRATRVASRWIKSFQRAGRGVQLHG